MQGRRITIFGGSGFVGRYVVMRLAAQGHRVLVATRRAPEALFLKPMGDVGQIQLIAADVRKPSSIARAVKGADIVINLVGILYEGGKQKFPAIQAEGARHIAEAAKAAGVSRLVHVSAIGADPEAGSAYARSKALGEAAVRNAFPDAVILRPSVIFGPEDAFFNRFAALARMLPFVPVIAGATRFQPVYVGDVADAIVKATADQSPMAGQTYELGGPEIYSLRQIQEFILGEIMADKPLINVPMPLARLQALFLQMLPHPPLTLDQLRLLKSDNIVGEKAKSFADIGIRLTPVEAIVPNYLRRFRPKGLFSAKPV